MTFDVTRRGFLKIGPGAALGLAVSGIPAQARIVAAGAPALRAMGTHTRLPAGFGGGTVVSAGTRTFTHFPRPVRRFKLVVPTFTVRDGPAVFDADIVADMNFQFGIDEAATPSLSRLAPRRLVTFQGDPVARYTAGQGPFGCIVSDWVEMNVPRTTIVIFSVQEWAGGVAPAPGMMPRNVAIGAGAPGYFEQLIQSNSSLIEAGWASRQSDPGEESTESVRGFAPYIIAEFSDAEVSVLLLGSSTGAGIGETAGGTGNFRENRGDAFGSRGWMERWLHRGPRLAFANLSKGGDRLKDHAVAQNSRRRIVLAKALNPTHAALQLGPNDFASSTLAEMQTDAIAVKSLYGRQISGLRWVGVTSTPRSISKSWLAIDGSDQTPRKGSGPGSHHEAWNRMIRRSEGCFADQSGYLDPCLFTEMTPLGCSKIDADGITPKLMTADGMHLTGDASERVVAGLGHDATAFPMPGMSVLPYPKSGGAGTIAGIMSAIERTR